MTRSSAFKYGSDRTHPGYMCILLHLNRRSPEPGVLAAELLEILLEHTEAQTTHAYVSPVKPPQIEGANIRVSRLPEQLRAIGDHPELFDLYVYCRRPRTDNQTLWRFRTYWLIRITQRKSIGNSPPVPQLTVSVPVYSFRSGEASAMSWLYATLDLLARRTAYSHGTVRLGSPSETLGGFTWSEYKMPWSLADIVRSSCLHFSPRSRRARMNGLEWGTILGPRMAAKLGDREVFIDEFNRRGRHSTMANDLRAYPQHIREAGPEAWPLPKRGVFFALVPNPIEFTRWSSLREYITLEGDEDLQRRIAWLIDRLREAELW